MLQSQRQKERDLDTYHSHHVQPVPDGIGKFKNQDGNGSPGISEQRGTART